MKRCTPPAVYLFAVLLLFAAAAPLSAATVTIDIYEPGQTSLRIAAAQPIGPGSAEPAPENAIELRALIMENFTFLPFMEQVQPSAVIGGTKLADYKGPGIDFKRFQLAEADLLLTVGNPDITETGATYELRIFEVFTGRLVVGKAYADVTTELLPKVADRFSAAFMETLTGRDEFFRSTLAFVHKSPGSEDKQIYVATPTGRSIRQVTTLPGFSLSPSWSPDGRYIVFSHIHGRFHSLGVWDRPSNEVRTLKKPGNTIIAPTFTPDNKVAVSMASGGNPDIFLLDYRFNKEDILIQNWAIDVSPSFDATGRKMAFVSSRLGNPHIFLHDLDTNKTTRVTYEGKYNTHPSLSPDGTLVVFSRRTDMGHRIFMHDIKTGMERQLTFGPGNDEEPSFAPDGYFLAFSSNRRGEKKIYLTTRHGDPPRIIPTDNGESSFPTWGMIPE